MRSRWAAIFTSSVVLSLCAYSYSHARMAPATTPEQAENLYNSGQRLLAAESFESLAEHDAKYFYFAGLAYEALGHDARAILCWQRALSSDAIDRTLREQTLLRIDKAKRRTMRLRAVVTPARAAGAAELSYLGPGDRSPLRVTSDELLSGVHLENGTWRIRIESAHPHYDPKARHVLVRTEDREATIQLSLQPQEQRVTLTISPPSVAAQDLKITLHDTAGLEPDRILLPTRSTHEFNLRPGTWTYRAEVPGFKSETGELTVTPETPTDMAITLESLKPLPSPLRSFAVGTGITGVLLAAGGSITLGVSTSFIERNCRTNETYDARCGEHLTDWIDNGPIVLGAATGFVLTSLTSAVRHDRTRRIALGAEAGLGAALTVAGAFTSWQSDEWFDHIHRWDMADEPDNLAGINHVARDPELKYRRSGLPLHAMFGVGAALFIGSITALLLDHRRSHPRRQYSKLPRIQSLAPFTLRF